MLRYYAAERAARMSMDRMIIDDDTVYNSPRGRCRLRDQAVVASWAAVPLPTHILFALAHLTNSYGYKSHGLFENYKRCDGMQAWETQVATGNWSPVQGAKIITHAGN